MDDLTDLLAAASAAVLVADSSGEIERATDHVEAVLGYEPADLVGERLQDLLEVGEGPDGETVASSFGYARNADGETVPVELTVASVEDDGDAMVVATIAASPEYDDRIEGLEAGEGQYRRLLDISPAPIVIYDGAGVVRYANEAVADLLDVSGPDAIVGDQAIEYVHEDDRPASVEGIKRVIEDREAVEDFERRIVTPDGDVRHAILSSVPITYDGGPAGQVLISDVTALKEREATLERQNERLDEFASIISHDLRNPLSVLESSLDLARESGDPEHFERAERAVDRMNNLLESLLTIARQGQAPEETEPVDLEMVAISAWQTVETPEATLEVTADGTVDAESTRLQELFENLFDNAIQHAGSDGEVTVTVEDVEGGFAVADDGVGIPPDERGDVFERGYSTKQRGTGYGLAIVEEIAEAHDWSVDLGESEAGGARFEIRSE